MYANVRGMKSKKASIAETLNEHNPQVFLLTETLLRSNTGISIDGYTFFGKCRDGKTGGGVGILIHNDIKKHAAPHQSERDIEILWISIRRKNLPPILIGSYYGKQETRTSKAEIEKEMNTLREEIIEMSKEGEILLAMDGNAKIGILGEPISRNGNLLLDVLKETNMKTLNNDPKCKGKVTRQNTKNKDEQSAIDFVVGSENMCQWVTEMVIDEEGLAKIKGKNETDHNTIIIDLNIRNIDRTFKVKHTSWNLRAGGEKWAAYAEQINAKVQQAIVIVNDDKKDINERYKLWSSEIEKSAWSTLGKTTYREKTKETFSEEVTELRKKKKTLKGQIQGTANHDEKTSLIDFYKIVQSNITDLIVKERTSKIEKKIQLILADNSRTSFWREKRSLSRNPALESLIIKDKTGNRIYAPEQIKEVTASYYENLYRNKNLPSRPYHIQLENRLTVYSNNREHESDLCNTPPTEAEISEIIENKKNGKSTTDFKNEMIKRPGEPMTKYITVLIKTVWKEEKVPKDWKKGLLTSLWKGKGDRETLENHRGITVSSTIGNILEEIIDRRIQASVEFTQAQRGGLKGASTYDHIFILQSTIAIALKQKRKTYITYFDVQKAYNNVDNNDMLGVMWEAGLLEQETTQSGEQCGKCLWGLDCLPCLLT